VTRGWRGSGGGWRRLAGVNAITRSRPRFGVRPVQVREGDTGNRSRAVGGDQIGHGGGATASGGSGTPASSCGHGEVTGDGKEGPVVAVPT
jgi:hypothetical protein